MKKALSNKHITVLLMLVYFSSYITRINFAAIIQEIITATGFGKEALAIIPVCLSITYGTGQIVNGMLSESDIGELAYRAADCNHDGVIDEADVDLLNQAGAILANIDQTKSAEVLLETSSAYVEYIELIDQSPEIEVEDETDAPEADAEDSDPIEENSIFTFIFEFISMLQKLFDFILSFVNV